ncbi:MAG: hypothetical protein Q9209_001105 [Squamulea sp. 1 TL-2023]
MGCITFLSIQPDQLYSIESDGTLVNVLDEAFDYRLEGFPIYKPGSLDLWIEFTYTLDLDLEVFSLDQQAHYRLNQIPKNGDWIKALFVDDNQCRSVHPQLVATEESLASLAVDNHELTVKDTYSWQSMKKKRFNPKLPVSSNLSAKVRSKLFEMFEQSEHDNLRVTVLSWTAEDLTFREYAFYILCLAAGGSNLAMVDSRRILTSRWTSLYKAIVCGHDPEGKRELVSSLATGFHIKNLPIGSAPPTSKYWLEGALICLVPRLDQAHVARRAIADAVRYGRDECRRASFNAILISILGVILLKCFSNGSVEYSSTIPLFHTRATACMNARQRYDDAELDEYLARHQGKSVEEEDVEEDAVEEDVANEDAAEEDAAEEDAAEEKAAEEKAAGDTAAQDTVEDSGTEPDNTGDDCETSSDMGVTSHSAADNDDRGEEESLPSIDVETAFLCLINFFDSTAFGTSTSETLCGRKLPVEIIRIILQQVNDMETYNACLKVSRAFRSICNERPLIMDDVVFMDPVPTTTAFDCHNQAYELEEPVLHDFRAVVLSSGKQLDVKFRRQCGDKTFAYRYIIGTDFNRRTMSKAFCILGFDTPAPFDRPLQQQYSQPHHHRSQSRDAETDYWDKALVENDIANSSYEYVRCLGRFWEEVTTAMVEEDMDSGSRGMGGSIIQQLSGEAWLLPPNTLHYFLTPNWHFGSHADYARYLFMLIKRGSRYWTCLWEDAIREAKEVLSGMDKARELLGRVDGKRVITTVQAVGAANPSVMLVVGTEVRLFEWRQLEDKAVDTSNKAVDTSNKPVNTSNKPAIQTSNGTTINIPNAKIADNEKRVFSGELTETQP